MNVGDLLYLYDGVTLYDEHKHFKIDVCLSGIVCSLQQNWPDERRPMQVLHTDGLVRYYCIYGDELWIFAGSTENSQPVDVAYKYSVLASLNDAVRS